MSDTETRVDFGGRKQALEEAHLSPASERPPSTARGIHHLALICSDPDQTMSFYQDLLGFPLLEIFENRDYEGSAHFFFDIGNGNLLAFFDFPGLDEPEWIETLGNMQHVAISATDENFEDIRHRLESAGIDYFGGDERIPDSIYFRGPDGERIEICRDPLLEMNGEPIGSDA